MVTRLPDEIHIDDFNLDRVAHAVDHKYGMKRGMEYSFIQDPETYKIAVDRVRQLKRIKMSIKQPPNPDVTLKGLSYSDFKQLLCQASLYCYDELDKTRAEENKRGSEKEAYTLNSLQIIKAIDKQLDKALKEHNATFKRYDQLTPKQKLHVRKYHKYKVAELRTMKFRKNRKGQYEGSW